MASELRVTSTPIPGLLVFDLPVHGDARGWFKEAWQRAKMLPLGLPDLEPVQCNMSYNAARGATRGLHAEPWDKLITLAAGRIFGAWVDLREGPSFGATFSLELGVDRAVFVPRGVANGYQALADDTVYTYLVNAHWSAEARAHYSYLNLADPTAGVPWPIPLSEAVISDADAAHPLLADARPVAPRRTLILGGRGQLGRALQAALPDADAIDLAELDLGDPDAVAAWPWADYGVVINAAAYTAVDAAETPQGRRDCWRANVDAVGHLAAAARAHRLTLVHVSSDYVFDGVQEWHSEDEAFSPLGVYGQTKAAGDALVGTLPRHYVVRTSWVIGEGNNFVRTMASLAERGIDPAVVDDQHGRLTFTSELARGIVHLLATQAPWGTYNLTGEGPVLSWFDIARRVFELSGHDPDRVRPISAAEYGAGKNLAPRPQHSALALQKVRGTGFVPADADASLREYLSP